MTGPSTNTFWIQHLNDFHGIATNEEAWAESLHTSNPDHRDTLLATNSTVATQHRLPRPHHHAGPDQREIIEP